MEAALWAQVVRVRKDLFNIEVDHPREGCARDYMKKGQRLYGERLSSGFPCANTDILPTAPLE